jgi:hypothetical protein
MFSTRICGIPCLVRINDFQFPDHLADSTEDYYGGFHYDVLDTRGRKADWLRNKMKDDDLEKLVSEMERFYFPCLY